MWSVSSRRRRRRLSLSWSVPYGYIKRVYLNAIYTHIVKTTANSTSVCVCVCVYYCDDNYCAYVVVHEADNNNNMCHGHGTRTTLIAPPPDNDYPRLLLLRRCRFPRGRVRVRIINVMRTFGFFFLLFSFFHKTMYTLWHTRTRGDNNTTLLRYGNVRVDGHCETFLFVSFFPRFLSARVSRKNDKIK